MNTPYNVVEYTPWGARIEYTEYALSKCGLEAWFKAEVPYWTTSTDSEEQSARVKIINIGAYLVYLETLARDFVVEWLSPGLEQDIDKALSAWDGPTYNPVVPGYYLQEAWD